MKRSLKYVLMSCLVMALYSTGWGNPVTGPGNPNDGMPAPIHPGGVVYESLQFYSDILGRDVSYSVYLPPGYEGSTMKFPVLYLLHGYSDDDTGWLQFGQVKRIADQAFADHKAAQMIIIMPDADVTWYVNTADGEEAYEDFLVDEFILHVDSEFRTRTDRQFRAVAGLSMGGYGAAMLALRHPDLFASCGALSAGILTDEEIVDMDTGGWNRLLGQPFGMDLEGDARLEGNYKQYAPQALIDAYKEKDHTTRFYIDCGDDDFLILGNMEFHARLIKSEVPHEFRVRDGGHSWSYWRTALPDVLAFISDVFHR